jgi:hypothetical protein
MNNVSLLGLLLFLFISLTLQAPAVNCGVSNVLEEFEHDQPITDCDDKTVCELNCEDYIPTCKHQTFLDLTELLAKDNNYQIAYQSSCQGGTITGAYLSDKLSLFFRDLVGKMTKLTQEWFFNTHYIQYIPLAKKYKNLYKTPIKVIKEYPEFKKNIIYVHMMIMFEYNYVKTVAHNSDPFMSHTLWGLYYYSKGLKSIKKICKKKFQKLKDKSLASVRDMIERAVYKEITESKIYNGQCEGFCLYIRVYQDLLKNQAWMNYFLRMRVYIRQFYANQLAKSLISGKKNLDRNYCKCSTISKLDNFLQDKRSSFDHIRQKFPTGFSLNSFSNFVKKFCQSKCEKMKPKMKVAPPTTFKSTNKVVVPPKEDEEEDGDDEDEDE